MLSFDISLVVVSLLLTVNSSIPSPQNLWSGLFLIIRANQKLGNLSSGATVTLLSGVCCSCSYACGQRAVRFILRDLAPFLQLNDLAKPVQIVRLRFSLNVPSWLAIHGSTGSPSLMACGLQLSGLAWWFGWTAC